ncbi:aldehyde dehydrogenase family protein [Lentzea kentuckyensis]|uniref:aldehyde dehydrogenase family protein n=1 Tax=Lentzea kentuckyensis TaxID=360086 RepID=UPI000A3911CC|nr:aldehyde dehydrogenase family protein [Lentzea kentuckyensis]
MTAMHAIDVHSPRDSQLIGWLPTATPSDVEDALSAARSAQPEWAATAASERGAAVRAAAFSLRERAGDLATVVETETGRPFGSAREGVLAAAATLEQYAELGPVHRGRSLLGSAVDFMVPEPRGVVVALTPWNDPIAVACGLLGAALVTGNSVVHKPSERCPHTGLLLATLLQPHFPSGVLKTLVGDGEVGAALVSSPGVDVVAHVGSTATGRAIARTSTAKLLLENGGNDPLLIDDDVDPIWAAGQAALGAFTNAGQLSNSVERIYAHKTIAPAFLEALCAEARSWNSDPQPLVDTRHRSFVHGQVSEAVTAGAWALVGGEILEGRGAYYPATVLAECSGAMRIMCEETFGPVAPVQLVSSFDEGLAEACSGAYGLAATVLTSSMEHAQRAWRALPVGTVKVNAVFGGAPGGAAQPRGASGSGFVYGPELLDEMTTTKMVHLGVPNGRS